MGKKKDLIYLAVTPDAAQNLLFETYDIKELAEWANVSETTIRSNISRNHSGVKGGKKYLALTPEQYEKYKKRQRDPVNGEESEKSPERNPKDKQKRRRRKIKNVYLAVTNDEYELPLGVFDTGEEAAKWANITINSFYVSICRNSQVRHGRFKFVKVNIEKDDDGEETE